MISFYFIFIHILFNRKLQITVLGLHNLSALVCPLDKRFVSFIHKKNSSNNNNNNILLL